MNHINLINDCISDDDYLGYLPYIEAFEYIICNHDSLMNLPVVFGIHGKWGVGKSTFMNLINKKLTENKAKKNIPNFYTIQINPWEYGNDQNFISIFLAKLYNVAEKELSSDEIGEDDYITKIFKSLLRPLKFSANTGILKAEYDIGKLSFNAKKTIIDDFISENFSMKEIIKNVLDCKVFEDRKIVVFIDDLDRCRSDKVMEVIESIKLVLDSKNCIFFLGCDKDYLENALSIRYKEFIGFLEKLEGINTDANNYKRNIKDFSREYLEKIIQVPFGIPPLNKDSIDAFIKCILFKENNSSGSKAFMTANLYEDFSKKLNYKLISDLIVKAELNPRKIKRIINLIFLNYVFIYFKFKNNTSILQNIDINILSILGFIRDVEQEYYGKYLSYAEKCKNTLLSYYSYYKRNKKETKLELEKQSFMQNQNVNEYFKIFFNHFKTKSQDSLVEKLKEIDIYITVSNTTTYENYENMVWGPAGEYRSEITYKKLKEFLNRLKGNKIAQDFTLWLFDSIYNKNDYVFGLQSNIHFYKKNGQDKSSHINNFIFRLEYIEKEKKFLIRFEWSTYKSVLLKYHQELENIKIYDRTNKSISLTNSMSYKYLSEIEDTLEQLISNY